MRMLLCTLLMLLISVSGYARAHVWYDKDAGIANFKKIAVFPIQGTKGFIGAEDAWKDMLQKNAKKVYFSLLQPDNSQLGGLLEANVDYERLLGDFPDEATRARAVIEATNADAYLICRIREDRIQTDWSPETECIVSMQAYTEESGGPGGYRKYDESSWTQSHVIPGQYVYLYLLNLDYTLYDDQGKKIMVCTNRAQDYGTTEDKQFKELLKEFSKELKIAVNDKGK